MDKRKSGLRWAQMDISGSKMTTDIEMDCFEFPFMPEEILIDKLRKHGHQVWDFRKDPTSPVKYIIQINSEDDYVEKADVLAIASLGIIAFYYSPTRHFVIEKNDWRPCNSADQRDCFDIWKE